MSVKNKPKQPQKRMLCQYCKEKIDEDNYYLCNCGYQMCWDCYDDFQDEKFPYCPKCDAELISDSEDEQVIKPKADPSLSKSVSMQPTGTQNQNKTSPQSINKSSSVNTTGATTTTTASTSQINNTGFNYNDLAKVRVIKKNLVYVIGLAPEIANEETLLKKEYFTQYGKITKIVVNTNNAYNPKGPNGPSYSAYITYSSEREASMAILGTEEYQINDRIIRASYGTTKYCSYFLKQQECPNLPDCLYLHSFGKDKEFFQKDEATSNKNIFIDQQKMAIKNIQKYIPDLIKIKNTPVTYNSVLPTPQSVIDRLIEQDVLDIKQKPVESTQKDNSKDDKKKKEDNTPLIDQWSIDFSTPHPSSSSSKKDDSKKQESSPQSQNLERKQSQQIQEKDLNTIQTPITASPQQNKQNPNQSENISKSKTESEKTKANGLTSSEEKINSKDEFLMKAINGIASSPNNSRSSSMSQPTTNTISNTTTTSKTIPILSNQNPSSANTNQSSNLLKTTNQPASTDVKKVEKSPAKEQQVQKQDDIKKEESANPKKAANASADSSNQSSNAASTNHSRNPSTNQKTAAAATTTTPVTSTINQTSNSNGNIKSNNTTSNGNHYEKKDNSKKEQSENKYQKHQYVPVSQSNKQTSSSVEPQKESANQQQQAPIPSQKTASASKDDSKQAKTSAASQAHNSVKQQSGNPSNQPAQAPQTTQNKVNNENASSSQLNQQNTQNQQNFIHQNHHIQQLQQQQSCESTTDNLSQPHQNQYHHQHTVSEPVAPKYILQKVEKLEKTLSSDNQIMKKLIIRTTQKSSSSRFDFAKNSENCDQPVEEIDVINHIFNGQYIILTKSQSCKSNNFDRSEY